MPELMVEEEEETEEEEEEVYKLRPANKTDHLCNEVICS